MVLEVSVLRQLYGYKLFEVNIVISSFSSGVEG